MNIVRVAGSSPARGKLFFLFYSGHLETCDMFQCAIHPHSVADLIFRCNFCKWYHFVGNSGTPYYLYRNGELVSLPPSHYKMLFKHFYTRKGYHRYNKFVVTRQYYRNVAVDDWFFPIPDHILFLS